MHLFPLFLKLEGRPCLVAGAGRVAEEKIASLLHAGARLLVVAPNVSGPIQELARLGKIQLVEREFQEMDLEGQSIVIAATNSSSINHDIFLAAQRHGLLCNSVDDPPNCDFYFAAVVERGSLQIAISTAGESPALAQQLKHEIDAQLPKDTGQRLNEIGSVRREILTKYPAGDERKALLHSLVDRAFSGGILLQDATRTSTSMASELEQTR